MNLLCKECIFTMKIMSEREVKKAIDESKLFHYQTHDDLYDHIEETHHLVCVRDSDGTFEKARIRFFHSHVSHCQFCQKEDLWREIKNVANPKSTSTPPEEETIS